MRFSRMSRVAALSLALVGVAALSAQAATVNILVHAWSDAGDLNNLVPGDLVHFQIGVAVDPAGGTPSGNAGLGALVYDVFSAEAAGKGYFLSPDGNPAGPFDPSIISDAQSGYDWNGDGPKLVSDDYYNPGASSTKSGYGGGWGFDRGGLVGGGSATSPGEVKAPGVVGFFPTFLVDTRPDWPGNQPNSRMGVGHGVYMADPDDQTLPPNFVMGFGQDLSNGGTTQGDGTWLVQEGVIDTSGWDKQVYNFDIIPVSSDVLDGSLDYNVDHGSGFRVNTSDDMTGDTFSFTLIPEPGTLGLVLMGFAAVVRRRRR